MIEDFLPKGTGSEIVSVPVFLDNNKEMLVAMVMVKSDYFDHFDACVPLTTHTRKCDEADHPKHLAHFSLKSSEVKS